MRLVSATLSGALYQSDCVDLLRSIPDSSVHMVFADPPFNLGKDYGPMGSDRRPEDQYLAWCREWLDEACRVLAPGGALYVYNLPKWLIPIGSHLNSAGMSFRHWVAIYKPTSLPIPRRLSPGHYGLLYYVKGDGPRVFNRDAVRVPIRTCRHCHGDIKDYGGHKKHLNAKGLNLTDIWDDVRAVRHLKYKNRPANELDPIVVERALLLSTRRGDVVVDPFVGSGTTAFVAQENGRKWICGELNDCSSAKDRISPIATRGSILDGFSVHRVPRAFSTLRALARTGEDLGVPLDGPIGLMAAPAGQHHLQARGV
jgi:site-specific DNA-methyltransferase (adenine-specific)